MATRVPTLHSGQNGLRPLGPSSISPEAEARFMAALDGFLTRKRDRELFGLAPLPPRTPG